MCLVAHEMGWSQRSLSSSQNAQVFVTNKAFFFTFLAPFLHQLVVLCLFVCFLFKRQKYSRNKTSVSSDNRSPQCMQVSSSEDVFSRMRRGCGWREKSTLQSQLSVSAVALMLRCAHQARRKPPNCLPNFKERKKCLCPPPRVSRAARI